MKGGFEIPVRPRLEYLTEEELRLSRSWLYRLLQAVRRLLAGGLDALQ
jgi:hypothetical protein